MTVLDERINEMCQLRPNWDSYGAAPPSTAVVELMRKCLNDIRYIYPPNHICPSAEGGGAFCWFSGTGINRKYADVEFFNDGEILAVMSPHEGEIEKIKVWKVEDVMAAVREISDWLKQ